MTDTDMAGMCSCDWDGYTDGSPSLYRRGYPKARKVHTCYECNRPITPGTKYEKITGLYCDGGFFELKTHLACAGIRRDFCCDMHGSVGEMFESTYGFSPFEIPRDDDD